MTDKKLTPKQARFVDEFLISLNATQAAIKAGYSAKTAQEQSSRLLSNVMVQDAIEKAMAKQSKRTEITADKVLERLTHLSAVAETEGQLSAAIRAQELVGKHLGMFIDRSVNIHKNMDEMTPAELAEFVGVSPDEFEAGVNAHLMNGATKH